MGFVWNNYTCLLWWRAIYEMLKSGKRMQREKKICKTSFLPLSQLLRSLCILFYFYFVEYIIFMDKKRIMFLLQCISFTFDVFNETFVSRQGGNVFKGVSFFEVLNWAVRVDFQEWFQEAFSWEHLGTPESNLFELQLSFMCVHVSISSHFFLVKTMCGPWSIQGSVRTYGDLYRFLWAYGFRAQ